MKNINLSEVIIPTKFSITRPKKEKLRKIRTYIENYGKLDKPLVLDNKVLTDNYIRYLVAVEKRLIEVPYVTAQEYKENNSQDRQLVSYIIGKFYNCEKEYTWMNPKNIPISVGDKVLVRRRSNNGNNKAIIVVSKIFVSTDKQLLKHKPVIKNLSAIKEM